MRHIRDDRFVSGRETLGSDTPVTPQKDLVTGVHYLVDETMVRHIDGQRDDKDIICSGERTDLPRGQSSSPMDIVKARALARYIRRSLSLDQIDASVLNRWQWDEGENSWPESPPSPETRPYGSLLVDDVCMVFPTRCETRFVVPRAFSCWAINEPHAP